MSFFAFQDVITATTGFLIIITIFLALDVHEVVKTGLGPAAPVELTESLQQKVEEIVALKERVIALPTADEDEQTLRRMIAELRRSIERLSPTSAPGPRPVEESEMSRELRIEKQRLLTRLAELEKQLPAATKNAKDADARLAALEQQVLELQSRLQKAYDEANNIRLIPDRTDTSKEPVLLLVQKGGFQLLTIDGTRSARVTALADVTKLLKPFPPASSYVVFYFKPSGALLFGDGTGHVRDLGYEIGYDVLPEGAEVTLGPSKS